jgi:SAM-dependent methyltransferase
MEYWDKRFLVEGKIWGDLPSKSANHALMLFKKHNISSILVPGSGYGRNTKLFSQNGFKVTGVEISKIAYEIALNFDPKTFFVEGSFLDISLSDQKYDAIYCFNLLHLFNEVNRRIFIKKCNNILRNPG